MKLIEGVILAATVVTLPFIWWVTWQMVVSEQFEAALWFAGITVVTWLCAVTLITLAFDPNQQFQEENA